MTTTVQQAPPANKPAATMPHTNVRVALAPGDGVGPEITAAVQRIFAAADAGIDWVEVAVGKKVYDAGNMSGVEQPAWDAIASTKVLLKGPITTPRGGGAKSVNVTLRKTLGLFANVRPCIAYNPFVPCAPNAAGTNVVVIRENEEDTYAGIEHQQTAEVTQCLKLITRPGCERIVRYAFDFAVAHGRKKVTLFVKDNIMKLTDGLMRKVFEEIAPQYPQIEANHLIIDIGAAKLAKDPARFDVIVTGNLYGDIVSDIAAEVVGSVGLAGSANIGKHAAMFEAVHGSAPDIAGRGVANPSGLLQAAVMMLAHLGKHEHANRIQNAWLRTLEDGVHTADIAADGATHHKVGTNAFADAVIERLGQSPRHLKPASFQPGCTPIADEAQEAAPTRKPVKQLVGVDIFLDWEGADGSRDAHVLGNRLTQIAHDEFLKLAMITNRGVKVYPHGHAQTFCTDHWRCRFRPLPGTTTLPAAAVPDLLTQLHRAGFDVIKTENLYTFDGHNGFSAGQGE